jgi:D-sedoheptulose 7-phosphate isomerase
VIEAIRRQLMAECDFFADMAASLAEPTAQAADLLIAALRGGGTIYVCGNGGSAADAQHIAGELVGRFLRQRQALACVALTTNSSLLTCIGNDYGFDEVFARQVRALVRPGDALWAISTSGNSANILKAAEAARQRGAKVLAMTGRSGGRLKDLADVALCVPADSTPRIQQGHLALLHILCGLVEDNLADPQNPKGKG